MSKNGNNLALLSPSGSIEKNTLQSLRVVGIDLGTTNSSISKVLLNPDASSLPDPRPIEVQQATTQGEYTDEQMPSMVALHNGQEYIGEGAKMLRAQMEHLNLKQNRHLFWECKNHIGTRRTYHQAPPGYRSAKEVSSKLLAYLFSAARKQSRDPIDSAVVTIPASFQSAQRKETVEAAKIAGLTMLNGGCLLDEPTAALIAYVASSSKKNIFDSEKNLLVFDFGGGTCDVAVFKLLSAQSKKPVDIEPLSVSRYCRLGGGDIDRAIIIEVLLPQLVNQNGIDLCDLDFNDKQQRIIPSLLSVAESLKTGLCAEITRKRKLGSTAPLERVQPGSYTCKLRSGKELLLTRPSLKTSELTQVLKPYLDPDFLYPQETEYVTTCSVFAPIKDALNQSSLTAGDIDYCLLVGGSSLIPQVSDSIGNYFVKSDLLQFEDPDHMLTAVSRGAALHSLAIALHGQGIFRTVTSDSISLRTAKDSRLLIGRGNDLPCPASGTLENCDLAVPVSSLLEPVNLRVELCGSTGKTIFAENWEIKPPVNQGDGLLLNYHMDIDQVFHLELSLAKDPDRKFKGDMENPLTHVVNVNARREKIMELEELMRTGTLSLAGKQKTTLEIANYEEELGRYERALSLLNGLANTSPDSGLLIKIALLYKRLKDFESEEKFYLEAARKNPASGVAYFNLSLSKSDQGENEQAMVYIDKAIDANSRPPYRVFKAILAEKNGNRTECNTQLELAFKAFNPLPILDNWELHWCLDGAKLAGDEKKVRECQEEQKKRQQQGKETHSFGLLPEIISGTQVTTR